MLNRAHRPIELRIGGDERSPQQDEYPDTNPSSKKLTRCGVEIVQRHLFIEPRQRLRMHRFQSDSNLEPTGESLGKSETTWPNKPWVRLDGDLREPRQQPKQLWVVLHRHRDRIEKIARVVEFDYRAVRNFGESTLELPG